MERWQNKVAIVTGASSGIGASIAKTLAQAGMVTIGLARRIDRVEALKKTLSDDIAARFYALQCDVSKEEDILVAFKFVEEKFGGVHVLVNNAGTYQQVDLLGVGNSEALRQTLDTNVLGLVLCSREAFQSMSKRSVAGHIININSIEGHKVPFYPKANLYPASKHAVTAITETIRNELRAEGTKIKVTSISPGFVRTEMADQCETYSNVEVRTMPMLEPQDIAEAVIYVLNTPPHVQVHELTIKPVGEHV
ncbi:farnesol dehydrogenase-like [Toxorhynchites rutilus septentrionalis]|uniref:farnesol dehydrogenase-like n=1 Tax=Toxorhynchites rutilus septentrionalis TaxID=329112 RepID=UPI00247995EA|nr:farnesol dehydrogenase-like [Toxorhynchites rutilus septentrionalis]